MKQKIVTFEVAKALKEAGYPQEYSVFGGTTCHYKNENTIQHHSAIGLYESVLCAPTYTSAWLWLWNTKNIQIEVADKSYFAKAKVTGEVFVETNPEEAIAKAIDYLVENKLLK